MMGHENTTDSPCSVQMVPNDSQPVEGLTKIWRIKGEFVESSNTTSLDCSRLSAGAHLITLEVVTEKMISSTKGVNIIRLPPTELTADERQGLPSISLGPETSTESVGWLSISALALVVSLVVFFLLVRNREPEALELPPIGPTPQVLADGSPDAEGLPTTVDDQGVLWRQHPGGEVDWWDKEWSVWHRWE